jgi:hypothetical protein
VSRAALNTLSIKLSNAAPLLGSVTRNVLAQVHGNWYSISWVASTPAQM